MCYTQPRKFSEHKSKYIVPCTVLQLVAWSQLLKLNCVHHSLFHSLRRHRLLRLRLRLRRSRLRLRRLRRLRCLRLAVGDAGDGLEHERGAERLVLGEG